MNFIKVKNPINEEVALLFRGETYLIGPDSVESFPIDVAKQWITIYQFMDFVGHAEESNNVEVKEEVVEEKEVKRKVAKKK